MGGKCCVPAKDKPSSPTRTGTEVPAHRNIRYSPSWSFRWDNRTHIEDIVDNQRFSQGNSGNVGLDIKYRVDTETGLSDGDSPFRSQQTPRWQKSPTLERTSVNTKVGGSDLCCGNNSPAEENDPIKSGMPNRKQLVHSPLQSSILRADPSPSCSNALPSDPTSSRKVQLPLPHQLSGPLSFGQIPALKSINESNLAEGRQSIAFPACSSDLSPGGSSDGWTMRIFSDLVSSSQRDRWSFDSETSNFGYRKSGPISQTMFSPPADLGTCGVCTKLLKESASWRTTELSVVAVLDCGHLYHADCLEHVTSEVDRYDPSCPICTHGPKSSTKLSKKAELKGRSKLSRIAVADIDVDGDSHMEHYKSSEMEGKRSKLGPSSSLKRSLSKPFLRRHFSVGSKSTSRSISENESTRKMGFWARHR